MAAFHPQTDGLVECMNQTLKGALRKVAYDRPTSWDLYNNPILFALREILRLPLAMRRSS